MKTGSCAAAALFGALAFMLLLAGCGVRREANETQAASAGDQLTLGTVQRNIRKGMDSSEVLEAMGSPNIVTSGESGTETWVYDKIATDTVHSNSGAWWFIVVNGGSGNSGATSESQRTLTVIVKFDEHKQVRDLAYHSSRF
jgi:outer membrane protein assembly factor BamE (lipoprotein component of BamABCDE complex)